MLGLNSLEMMKKIEQRDSKEGRTYGLPMAGVVLIGS
jgi:hypothetical protein